NCRANQDGKPRAARPLQGRAIDDGVVINPCLISSGARPSSGGKIRSVVVLKHRRRFRRKPYQRMQIYWFLQLSAKRRDVRFLIE
ncbi:MAG: hypothetical protein ACXWJW_16535, partial [Xanthobacteraceae bacterium]